MPFFFFCLWLKWQKKSMAFTFYFTCLFPKFCLTKERSFKNCDSGKSSSHQLELMVHWKSESENQLYNQRVIEIIKAGKRGLWRSHRAASTQSRTNLKADQDAQDLVHWICVSPTETWQIFWLPLSGLTPSHCERFSLFIVNIVSIVSWPFTEHLSVQHQSTVHWSPQHLLKGSSEVPHTTFSILTLFRVRCEGWALLESCFGGDLNGVNLACESLQTSCPCGLHTTAVSAVVMLSEEHILEWWSIWQTLTNLHGGHPDSLEGAWC